MKPFQHETTVLYEKVGRRYKPCHLLWTDPRDIMKPGTFRLTYAYGNGGYCYSYDITPATAAWAAAAAMARQVMVEAMREAAASRPSEPRKYTKKELAIIKKYRKEMAEAGGSFPEWWAISSPYEIADAAIKALEEWKP